MSPENDVLFDRQLEMHDAVNETMVLMFPIFY